MKRRQLTTVDRHQRDHDAATGRFKPGNRASVGNLEKGRSARLRRQLTDAIGEELPSVIAALLSKCLRGDVQALKLALNYGIGSPPSKPGATDELVGERTAALIMHAQQIKPRELNTPDLQLVEDVATLAELGLPADGVADLVGVDTSVLHDWLQQGEAEPDTLAGDLVRSYAAGFARYRLRLGVQSESRPLHILERRDPQSYGQHDANHDHDTHLPDEHFL